MSARKYPYGTNNIYKCYYKYRVFLILRITYYKNYYENIMITMSKGF